MIGAVRVVSYVALCLAPFSWSLAQVDSTALRYANTITIDDLRRHLSILASDEYQGRDTGQEGQKMAAQYLTQQFSSFGIPPVPASDPAAIVQGYLQLRYGAPAEPILQRQQLQAWQVQLRQFLAGRNVTTPAATRTAR